ncbi:hypothetical protein MHU86_12823 [Fragilaria crotonensis]|nr:hypothetical protein MHU86_12823 [Fragilaria crotonensis]
MYASVAAAVFLVKNVLPPESSSAVITLHSAIRRKQASSLPSPRIKKCSKFLQELASDENMAVVAQPQKRRRIFTPTRVVVVIALAFGVLFFLENNRADANDYDTNVVNALRKEGYDVVVEGLGEKTEPPKLIHIQEPSVDLEVEAKEEAHAHHEKPRGKPWPSPMEIFGPNAALKLVPLFGAIRPEKDAVFSFAGGVPFNNLVRFLGSLLATGFDGDIVIAVSQKHELDAKILQYVEYHAKHSHLVVYQAELVCKKIKMKTRCKLYKMFAHKDIGGYLPDPRPHREMHNCALSIIGPGQLNTHHRRGCSFWIQAT